MACQFGRGPCPAVQQRQAEAGAGSVGEQPGQAGQVRGSGARALTVHRIQYRPLTVRPAPKSPAPMVGRMNDGPSAAASAACPAGHVTITPAILYFGTPVVLLSTENEDGSFNLAPMSSAWALGQVIVLGLGTEGQTARNLRSRPDLVINVPAPEQWQAVERLAPLT